MIKTSRRCTKRHRRKSHKQQQRDANLKSQINTFVPPTTPRSADTPCRWHTLEILLCLLKTTSHNTFMTFLLYNTFIVMSISFYKFFNNFFCLVMHKPHAKLISLLFRFYSLVYQVPHCNAKQQVNQPNRVYRCRQHRQLFSESYQMFPNSPKHAVQKDCPQM